MPPLCICTTSDSKRSCTANLAPFDYIDSARKARAILL